MNAEDLQAFFDRRQEAWNRQDPDGLIGGYHDDAIIESPVFGVVRGRAAIAEQYRSWFRTFPDFTFAREELIIDGLHAAQTARCSATHTGELMGLPGSGRRILFTAALFYRFTDGGLIVNERRIYDFTGFLMQLGVLKGKLR
ncbi:MAG: ester cyclase [Acidobacteria bacterium]|nr:ester cyclase [Acidobacteriota bacterium]